MAFKMKGWQAHGNSPLDNYKKGYYGEGKSSGLKKVGTEGPPKGRIGSEYRKAEYDARGWAYDDTIAGYNRDGTPINTKSTPTHDFDQLVNQKNMITTKRPGGGKKEVRTDTDNFQTTIKYRKDGTKKKEKSDMDITNPDSVKFKDKYDKKGNLRKEKMISRFTEGEIDVDKTKYDKEGNVIKKKTRTRKKGGTGLGAAIKDTKVGKFLGAGQSEKRKARRAKLRESRGNMGSDKQLKAVRAKIKGLFGGKK